MADPKKHAMVALQTIPARPGRKALARGDAFEATTQERRDLLQAGRAQDSGVGAADGDKPAEAKRK